MPSIITFSHMIRHYSPGMDHPPVTLDLTAVLAWLVPEVSTLPFPRALRALTVCRLGSSVTIEAGQTCLMSPGGMWLWGSPEMTGKAPKAGQVSVG